MEFLKSLGLGSLFKTPVKTPTPPRSPTGVYNGATLKPTQMDAIMSGDFFDGVQITSGPDTGGFLDRGDFNRALPDTASGETGGIGLGNALEWGNLVMGVGSYFNERDKLKMYEKALQDQLQNSELARSQTADDLINQAGVRASLAGAVGADTSSYDQVSDRYSKYLTQSAPASQGLGSVSNNASPVMAAGKTVSNKSTPTEYAVQLANSKKSKESM